MKKTITKVSRVAAMPNLDVDKMIKIQGTDFDRKRKLTDKQIAQMRKLFKKGAKISDLAEMFGVSTPTVRYNVDDEWKETHNRTRSGAHTGIQLMDYIDRVTYKRTLVDSGAIRI